VRDRGFDDAPAICPPSIQSELNSLVFLQDGNTVFRSVNIANQQLPLLIMLCCSNFQGSDWDLQAFLILAIAQQNYLIAFGDRWIFLVNLGQGDK
jgi:hypothetical protein